MDMLIDGTWTGASDGAVGCRHQSGDRCGDRPQCPRATAADADAGRRRGAGRCDSAWRRCRRTSATRFSRRVARRIEANQDGARRAALPRERQAHRRDHAARSASPPASSAATPRRPSASSAARCRSIRSPAASSRWPITMRQPLGVIAAIVPFNYPVELWSHKVAGGLAAGNAVITKTPEDCPLAVIEIADTSRRPACRAAPTRCVTGGARRRRGAGRAPRRADDRDDRLTAAGRRILEAAAAHAEEGAPRTRRQ